jgi:hypothetical protein
VRGRPEAVALHWPTPDRDRPFTAPGVTSHAEARPRCTPRHQPPSAGGRTRADRPQLRRSGWPPSRTNPPRRTAARRACMATVGVTVRGLGAWARGAASAGMLGGAQIRFGARGAWTEGGARPGGGLGRCCRVFAGISGWLPARWAPDVPGPGRGGVEQDSHSNVPGRRSRGGVPPSACSLNSRPVTRARG